MGLSDDVRRFAEETKRKERDVFVGCVGDVHGSITEGSALTGAPGQPVDTAYLIRSWQEEFVEDLLARITTNVAYAPAIEDDEEESYDPSGVDRPEGLEGRPSGTPSPVGGPHSVRFTRLGWDRIVEANVRRVAGVAA